MSPTRATRRCSICNINWADDQAFATCAQCDGETVRKTLPNDDHIDTVGESRLRAQHLKAAADAELAETRRRSIAAREALARTARAAAAALHHDADHTWLEASPAEVEDWVRGG